MGEIDIKRQAPNVAYENVGPKCVRHFQDPNNKRCDKQAISRLDQQSSRHYYIIGSVVGPHPYPDMVARFKVSSLKIKTQLLEKKEQKT
jgi:tryptophan synthase beta chain